MNSGKKWSYTTLIACFINGLLLTALLTSCGGSGESVAVEIGKDFDIDGKKLKIEQIKASTILSDDNKKMSVIAPEGKKYVYFELSNPDDAMVFIKANADGESITPSDDMTLTLDFSHEVGEGYNDAYFLVDENQAVEFSVTTPSGNAYEVSKVDLTVNNDREILPEMKELLTKYSSPVNLLNPLEPYVEGKVIKLAKERGQSVPTSPMTENMTIDYVFPNGQKYHTSTEGFISTKNEITWENGKIIGFEFGW